ncbi:hypothetical protein TNIN_209991 [Trichonephila inaurata madagascariensis]|uniref:Uncharacterized protein n=1 Tax=Trichonephila inaurata madagascariensis TaxID=2747483 RepID=A0A8X6JSP4_9ARAC|nr:hypothetical protein TNIN_209991 [Trichonephila inaurata madagascariensis]
MPNSVESLLDIQEDSSGSALFIEAVYDLVGYLGKVLEKEAFIEDLGEVGYCVHREGFQSDIPDLVVPRSLVDVQLGNDVTDFTWGGERWNWCSVVPQEVTHCPVHFVDVVIIIGGPVFGKRFFEVVDEEVGSNGPLNSVDLRLERRVLGPLPKLA